MRDLDKGRNDLGAVDGATGARRDLSHDDRPSHEIGEEWSSSPRGHGLGVVLLAPSSRPYAAVLGEGHHQQGLPNGDEQARRGQIERGTQGSYTYVPQIRQKGPPMSKMVEYRTTRHDQLHEIIIWYATTVESISNSSPQHGGHHQLTGPKVVHTPQFGLLAHGHEQGIIAADGLCVLQRQRRVQVLRHILGLFFSHVGEAGLWPVSLAVAGQLRTASGERRAVADGGMDWKNETVRVEVEETGQDRIDDTKIESTWKWDTDLGLTSRRPVLTPPPRKAG